MCFFGHGQNLKLGLRSGVSFSNFYAHHAPGDIPNYIIQPPSVEGNLSLIFDPNLHDIASYHYETDFIQDLRVGLIRIYLWNTK